MSKKDDKIIEEARKRMARAEEADQDNRTRFVDDMKFSFGDSDNRFQWNDSEYKRRDSANRPALTINKTEQHVLKVLNQARINTPQIKIYAADGAADPETADILDGMIRHIQYDSDAEKAYDIALETATRGGVGYWRVLTEYEDETSFNQDVKIQAIHNPLTVFIDPDCKDIEGADARFAFIYEDISKEEFEARYPHEEAKAIDWVDRKGWLKSEDDIRIAEYFRVVEKADRVYVDAEGETLLRSEVDPETLPMVEEMAVQSRQVMRRTIEWYLLAADKILDQNTWPGRFIPVVRIVGQELNIEGKRHRKGLTSGLKDPQRMYNYWTSSAVEHVALQSKVPWLLPAEAVEGHEKYWNNANTDNVAYLPYNAVDASGNAIPAPSRNPPPTMAPAYIQGLQVSSEELKMASGQYDASMGAQSNETSGRAIWARQQQGDTATYHYIDNQARALRFTGRILIDLIPKIYDVARVVRVVGEDGERAMAKIDPGMDQAMSEQTADDGTVEKIYNPGVGKYDVVVSVGPAFASRRQEAFAVLSDMAARNPALMQVAGDLIMKAADFPMADDLADRIRKTIPPQLVDDTQDPQVIQLQQQLQQAQQQMQAMAAALDDKQTKDAQAFTKLDIDRHKADTERAKVFAEALTPEQIAAITQLLSMQMVKNPLGYQAAPEQQAAPGAPPQPMPIADPRTPAQPPSDGGFSFPGS